MVTYRAATIKDVEELSRLWTEFIEEHDSFVIAQNPRVIPLQKMLPEAPEVHKRFLSAQLNSKDSIAYLAIDGDVIVGYLFAGIRDNIPIYEIKKTGHLYDLYVKKKYRGQRISSRLFAMVTEFFKQKNIKMLSLPVYNDKPDAHAIYKKWGFFDYYIEMRKELE